MIPDNRPKATSIVEKISKKSTVTYFPMPQWPVDKNSFDEDEKIHLVWAHRWEHDKDPDLLISALQKLKVN